MNGNGKLIKIVIGTASVVGITLLVAPIIPVQMEWVVSYETIAFDTVDGDLSMDQYAVNGDIYYIREESKNKEQFTSTNIAPIGKTEINILAQKEYDNEGCIGSKVRPVG